MMQHKDSFVQLQMQMKRRPESADLSYYGNGPMTDSAWHLWAQVVHENTRRRLSYPADKVRALAALADVFRQPFAGDYFLGVWEKHAATGLFWHPDRGSRPTQHLQWPTWSWLSCEGPVFYCLPPLKSIRTSACIEVICFELGSTQAQPTSVVSDATFASSNGWLRVRAALKRASLVFITRASCRVFDHYSNTNHQIGFGGLDNDGVSRNVWCLPVVWRKGIGVDALLSTGLLLANQGQDGKTYTRIGSFGFMKGRDEDWFEGSSVQEFKVI